MSEASDLAWLPHLPLDLPASTKLTITTTSTLVLLALLRCNRILVPWLLRVLRERRIRWVKRVPLDVERELHRNPNARHLCAGPCCRQSYGTFSAAASDAASEPRSAAAAFMPSVQSWASAVYAEYSSSLGLPSSEEKGVREEEEEELGTEEKIYIKLRVEQEKRHRVSRKLRFMVPDELFRFYTLITLLVYSALIVYVVVHVIEFGLGEGVSFAVSLVWSGAISEWDVLWPSRYGPPVWMDRKGYGGQGGLPSDGELLDSGPRGQDLV